MQTLVNLLPFVLVLALGWLMVVRPAQRRQQRAIALQQSLSAGDRVMTTSGLFGTITEVSDDEVALEVAPGVVVRFARAAINSVVPIESASEMSQSTDMSAPGA